MKSIGVILLFVGIGCSGCKSNPPGTYVPIGKEGWAGREIVMDTRTGQGWIIDDGGSKGRYISRWWIEYAPPIEGREISMWNKLTGVFKWGKEEPPPPPPPAPEAIPLPGENK